MLEIAVLGLLVETDLHGYELKKRITELLGPWSSVSFGSLYPALARLERNGLVASAAAGDAEPGHMSGSLGAELAAFRARGAARSTSGRRARKVYAITPAGRAALAELLDDDAGDDRAFALRVAFCRLLDPAVRLELFHRRRRAVVERISGRGSLHDPVDRYRRRLLEFQDDRLHRELAWLDDLIAAESADEHPTGDDPALTTPGGSPR